MSVAPVTRFVEILHLSQNNGSPGCCFPLQILLWLPAATLKLVLCNGQTTEPRGTFATVTLRHCLPESVQCQKVPY